VLLAGLAASSEAAAGPRGEPLIFTTSPDPDPDFVPPREPRRKARPARARKTAKPTMNQVMEDLGRVTGQLELLGEQIRQTHATQADACAKAQDQSDCSQ
jgi:hypothetical protein